MEDLFEKCLSDIDPLNEYKITKLDGGRVNLTVRAVKVSQFGIDRERFPGRGSIVLKYAGPWSTIDGQVMTLSKLRQTIEARALKLFCLDGELHNLCKTWDINIPELLYHDLNRHIIIMADIRGARSLAEELECLTLETDALHELGTRLGGFMAELHSPRTWEKLGPNCEYYFDNPEIRQFVQETMIAPVHRTLDTFNISDRDLLYERISGDNTRLDKHSEKSFKHGDFWTGSVLLCRLQIYIIDWEFAGIGRGTSGDMAIIFAQLHLRLLQAQDGSLARDALRTLIHSTAEQYRRQHHKFAGINEEWSQQNGLGKVFTDDMVSTIRSTYITHGRKMINNAVERDWICDCCSSQQELKQNCKLIRRMVDRGVWYLRTAGENNAEFAEESNWNDVKREEEKVLLRLFLKV